MHLAQAARRWLRSARMDHERSLASKVSCERAGARSFGNALCLCRHGDRHRLRSPSMALSSRTTTSSMNAAPRSWPVAKAARTITKRASEDQWAADAIVARSGLAGLFMHAQRARQPIRRHLADAAWQGPACASLGRLGTGQGNQLGLLLAVKNPSNG